MKRTPLKRKTAMTRTGIQRKPSSRLNTALGEQPRKRLRAKSKAESKEHAAYRFHWQKCELRAELYKLGVWCSEKAASIHHIQWGHSRRRDAWTNMISLSREAHDWVHKHPAEGRILCLYVKQAKKELDWQKLDELYRGNALREMSYRDYVSTLKPMEIVRPYHAALVREE